MPRFVLHEVREPHRRIAQIDSNTDPKDAEACVALLRRLAIQHGRKPGEVILRWNEGKRVLTYHA
jgi:hypothetical protein